MNAGGVTEIKRTIGVKFKDTTKLGVDWLFLPMTFYSTDVQSETWPLTSHIELGGKRVDLNFWKKSRTGKLFYREA